MSLDAIRRKHKWLTLVILFFISITFILGIGYFTADLGSFPGGQRGSAAKVNGEDISYSVFYIEKTRIEQLYKEQGLSDLSNAQSQIEMLALQNTIDRRLLAQKARELGFVVSDEEVNDAIVNSPGFQQDGKFVGKELYENVIKRIYDMDPGQYEDHVREQLLLVKILNFIDQTVLVTDENLYESFKKGNEKINLYYAAFSADDYVEEYTPSEEKIENDYTSKKSQMLTPELRKIKYIVLGPEDFEKAVSVTDEEITSYYNGYTEEFLAEDGSTRKLEDVREEIINLYKSQRGGQALQDFIKSTQEAGEVQKDLITIAAENGNMEIIESESFTVSEIREDIPPNITKSAFALEEGVTGVMPTLTGISIWVIEVSEIAPSREKTLDEAKEEIIASLKTRNAKNAARRKAYETLGELKDIKQEELSKKAKDLGIELKETGLFTRNEVVPEIAVDNLNIEAFEIDRDLPVSGKVYTGGDTYYIVSVKELQEADSSEYELKKDLLKEQELIAQRNNITQTLIQDLRIDADIISNNQLFQN